MHKFNMALVLFAMLFSIETFAQLNMIRLEVIMEQDTV